jgi:hypothetical protein
MQYHTIDIAAVRRAVPGYAEWSYSEYLASRHLRASTMLLLYFIPHVQVHERLVVVE